MVVKSVTADLEEIREAMRKAKSDERPKRITSLRQAVSVLLPEIEDLRKAKWSDAEISEWMGKRGLNISAGTLAQYVRESRKLPAERLGVRSAGVTREKTAAPTKRDTETRSERKSDAAPVHGPEASPDAQAGVPPNAAPDVAPNAKADAGRSVTPNAKAAATTKRRVNDDA